MRIKEQKKYVFAAQASEITRDELFNFAQIFFDKVFEEKFDAKNVYESAQDICDRHPDENTGRHQCAKIIQELGENINVREEPGFVVHSWYVPSGTCSIRLYSNGSANDSIKIIFGTHASDFYQYELDCEVFAVMMDMMLQ